MRSEYTIPLSQIEKEFSLERVTVPENYESILIATPEVWRPGLALAGFFEFFALKIGYLKKYCKISVFL